MNKKIDIAKYIDHTLLKPEATSQDIEKLVKEAMEYGFFGVCVNSSWVPFVKKLLQGVNNPPKVVSVVGFPLGAMATEPKACEAKWAVDNGADEIDMVIHIGKLKERDFDYVRKDIEEVVKKSGVPVKVIIEAGLLTDEEKVTVTKIIKESGAAFVKTSTGFLAGGATIEDVKLLRETVGPEFGVKASGGIRDYEKALKMIEAGANRIGTSSGVAIVKGETGKEAY